MVAADREWTVDRRPALVRALDAVFREGPLARRQLQVALGTSASTTTEVVHDLLGRGLIVETGMRASTGGRPARMLDLSPTLGIVLAADIGAINIRMAAGSLRGEVLAQQTVPTPAAAARKGLQRTFADTLAVLRAGEVRQNRVRAVVIGLAAIVDPADGSVSLATVPGWKDRDSTALLDWIRAEFEGCPLVLENEANLAALGEYRYGSARGARDVLFVAVGAGVGAGLVLNGSLFRGHRGSAGEIGLTRLSSARDAVELDRLAGAEALVRRYREAGGADGASGEAVFAHARSGDPVAATVIAGVVADLAVGIANAISLISPEKVVIGGGLAEAGAMVIEPLRQEIRQLIPEMPEIVASALGQGAALVGGLYLAAELARGAIATELQSREAGNVVASV